MIFVILGGGTFDVAILSISKLGFYDMRSTNGDTRLGGYNFDTRLMEYCVEDLKKDCLFLESKEDLMFLRKVCEQAKTDLTSAEETKIVIDWIPGGLYEVCVTRKLYEDMIKDYIQTTIACVNSAIEDARMKKDSIDEIILVGGSTQMPIVRSTLKDFFGKDVNISLNPHEAGKKYKFWI